MRPHRSSFESEEHRGEFIAHLTSGSGYVPLKFAYSGSAAITHDNAAKLHQYTSITARAQFEARQLASYVLSNGVCTQVCDIGPGNGDHTLAILHGLMRGGIDIRRYLALDFSNGMLDLTELAVKDKLAVNFSRAIWDFESNRTMAVENWRRGLSSVLALFLGLTFGNVESPSSVISLVRDSLRVGDILGIGVALRTGTQDRDALLSPYRTSLFRAAVFEPLLAAGIPDEAIDLELEVEEVGIVAYAVLRVTVDVEGGQIAAGSRIRCFLSRRFDVAEIDSLLAANRWRRISPIVADSAVDFDLVVVEAI